MSSNAIHGKAAILYLSPGAGVAVPVSEQVDWSIDYAQPLVDVTPLNNTWRNFVKGLSEWTATFAGNFDQTSKTLWNASLASVKSSFYLYPLGSSAMGQYYWGSGWPVLGKIAAGSTTAKASQSFKMTGDDVLNTI